jgi:hypothetical protein
MTNRCNRPDLAAVTVNASSNAVAVYRWTGFVQTQPAQTVHGIHFVPVARHLDIEPEGKETRDG